MGNWPRCHHHIEGIKKLVIGHNIGHWLVSIMPIKAEFGALTPRKPALARCAIGDFDAGDRRCHIANKRPDAKRLKHGFASGVNGGGAMITACGFAGV